MYFLVNTQEFREHTLKLRCSVGTATFNLTFTNWLNPVANALPATTFCQQ